jgi:hypothetical protein
MNMGALKIMSALRLVCLAPVFLVYGAWMLFKFTLGLVVLLLMAWLIHTVFGFAGDVALALPLIYVLSYLLPSPRIGDMTNKLTINNKTRHYRKILQPGKVVEFKTYQRGTK